MPKIGTSSAIGVIVAAGWRASSQPHAAKPNITLAVDCHSTAPHVIASA